MISNKNSCFYLHTLQLPHLFHIPIPKGDDAILVRISNTAFKVELLYAFHSSLGFRVN